MLARASLAVLLAAGVSAESPPPAPVSGRTVEVEITARLIIDKEGQIKAVGSDLKRQYAIVELTVVPRGGYPVTLSRDDFLLRSERDNERSTADSPDRIAGSATLVVTMSGGEGRTRTGIGLGPIMVGGAPSAPQNTVVSSSSGAGEDAASNGKPAPLLGVLQQKELPLGEARKPVTGYLYFLVAPQQKAKNFHLHYTGPGGSCELRFK